MIVSVRVSATWTRPTASGWRRRAAGPVGLRGRFTADRVRDARAPATRRRRWSGACREPEVALVGCGKIADGHVEEIQKMPARARGRRGVRPRAADGGADGGPLRASRRHYDAYDRMLDRRAPRRRAHHDAAPVAPGAGARGDRRRLPRLRREAARRSTYAGVAGARRPRAAGEETADGRLHVPVRSAGAGDAPAARRRACSATSCTSRAGTATASPGSSAPRSSATRATGCTRLPGKLFQNNIDHVLNKLTEFIDDDEPRIEATAWRGRATRTSATCATTCRTSCASR